MRAELTPDQTHQALTEKFNGILQLAEKKENGEQLLEWINLGLKPGPHLLGNEKTLNLYNYLELVLGSDPTAAEKAAQELLTLAETYQPSTSIQQRNEYLTWGSGLSIGGVLALIVLLSLPPIQSTVAFAFFVLAIEVAVVAALTGVSCLMGVALDNLIIEKGPRECIQAIAKASSKTSTPPMVENMRLWLSAKKQAFLKNTERAPTQYTPITTNPGV